MAVTHAQQSGTKLQKLRKQRNRYH